MPRTTGDILTKMIAGRTTVVGRPAEERRRWRGRERAARRYRPSPPPPTIPRALLPLGFWDGPGGTGRKIGVAVVSEEGGVGRDDLGTGARGGTGAVVVGGGGRTGDGVQTKAAGDAKATAVDGR